MVGCEVTVVDFSPQQLEIDRNVAERYDLPIRCVEGDISSLVLADEPPFDLVYQPISSCYISDLRSVYEHVYDLLRPRGLYRVEHWNSVHMRIWSEGFGPSMYSYSLPVNGNPSDAIVTTVSAGPSGEDLLTSWTFPHSLSEQIGTLCDTGFVVRRFAEDAGGDVSAAVGTEEHLAAFVPPFFRLLARKLPR
jgi:SAM-dependent methyltransferase